MEEKFTAFFDSGVGGLALLGEFCKRFPGERCIYYGDNANAPYGNRPHAEICFLAEKAFAEISRYPIKAALIACNTVTAECVEEMRKKYTFPIVGIEPAIKPAALSFPGGKVLLLATRATLQSERMEKLLSEYSAAADLIPYCPQELAGAVEKNIFDLEKIPLAEHLPKGEVDAVVLGCTHYSFLRKKIESWFACPVFDGIAATVRRLAIVANICSENDRKTVKNGLFFMGSGAKKNKSVFETMN